jgi:hypothetical protein
MNSFEQSDIGIYLYKVDNVDYNPVTTNASFAVPIKTVIADINTGEKTFVANFPVHNIAYEKGYPITRESTIYFEIELQASVDTSLINFTICRSVYIDFKDIKICELLNSHCYSAYFDAHELFPFEIKFKKLKFGWLISQISAKLSIEACDIIFKKYCNRYNQYKLGPFVH